MVGWSGGRVKAAIARLVEKGWLVPVAVEELPRQRFFLRRDDLPALEAAAESYHGQQGAALIAPLDNLMWDLNLVEMLFGFRYAWEVYKPADKRHYGYYVLPVLYGDRLVARLIPHLSAGRCYHQELVEAEVDEKDQPCWRPSGLPGSLWEYLDSEEIQSGPDARHAMSSIGFPNQ
jgi:uncharacterized protein YcaQ